MLLSLTPEDSCMHPLGAPSAEGHHSLPLTPNVQQASAAGVSTTSSSLSNPSLHLAPVLLFFRAYSQYNLMNSQLSSAKRIFSRETGAESTHENVCICLRLHHHLGL